MFYREYIPTEQLRPFVDNIWVCDSPQFFSKNLTVPLINHELVINFSDDFRLRVDSGNEINNPGAWISGFHTEAYSSSATGRHNMVGVLFKPTGLKRFTGPAPREFVNGFVDPGDVFGNRFARLKERLFETKEPLMKVVLVERFLLQCLNKKQSPGYLDFAIEQLSKSLGEKGHVSRICKRSEITNKSLIKAFDNHVGVSPRKFSHLQVVNKALLKLASNPNQSLTNLTYDLNFFDQPHFVRVFKSVTNLTPSKYADLVIERRIDQTTPNFIDLKG